MAHLCIKYRLNSDGTVPDFLCLHEEGVGGAFGVASPGTTQHDDTVFIGLSELGFENDTRFEIVPTKEALEAYLTDVGANWTQPDPNNPAETLPFDAQTAATWVWNRLEALNAAE